MSHQYNRVQYSITPCTNAESCVYGGREGDGRRGRMHLPFNDPKMEPLAEFYWDLYGLHMRIWQPAVLVTYGVLKSRLFEVTLSL